jgi:tetratricopeptide (TPR) repeat protein
MKSILRFVGICILPLAGVSVAACVPFLDGDFWQSRPPAGMRAVQADLRPSIGYYERAATAINDRRYALALEYLQAARNQKPDDVRVLTAFGVIYDKLGRFDLSARYYSQAAALDPKSRIIAADMDYSRKLQGASGSGPVMVAAKAEPDQGPQIQTQAALATQVAPHPVAAAEPHRDAVRTAQPQASRKDPIAPVLPATKAVFLTGHPLTIVDASGRGDTDKSVRTYLSGLGWSVAKSDAIKLPARPQTTIVYKESMITAAKALARTLSLPMHLSASDTVEGLQLVLGGDVSVDTLAARSQQVRQRQLASAISKPKAQE